MKLHTSERPAGKYSSPTKLLLRGVTILCISLIPLYVFRNSPSPLSLLSPLPSLISPRISSSETTKECNIYSGKWVPDPGRPYYTNETCRLIIDQQNCLKHGRADTDFMKWRWKPDECELPLFDAVQFLELLRDRKMAFVGDSVGRNQMQSLLCLLATVANPEDMSRKYFSDTIYFQRWYYAEYNFTVATLWSPFLVKARNTDHNGYSLMNLYLDQPDVAWTSHIEDFDHVIVSAGQWFFRPVINYINNQVVGCYNCNKDNVTDLTIYYGYRMAFRTTFKTLVESKRYKGITFLRTFSPAHFENGAWNAGGSCPRTKPFTKEEQKSEGYQMEFFKTQVEELRKAEEEGKKSGLKFQLLAITEAMLQRPDGHPNHYGHDPRWNKTTADCVHWCLPGPIDTWNEFLLYMLKRETQRSFSWKLYKRARL